MLVYLISVNERGPWPEKWSCERFDGGTNYVAWAIILAKNTISRYDDWQYQEVTKSAFDMRIHVLVVLVVSQTSDVLNMAAQPWGPWDSFNIRWDV